MPLLNGMAIFGDWFIVATKDNGIDVRKGRQYKLAEYQESLDDGLFRVIDESGEDYLYPMDNFLLGAK